MPNTPTPDPAADAEALIACPANQRDDWFAAHRAALRLELLQALKQRSDALLLTDPVAADELTACALLVARQMPTEPLASPLAAWARGNWEAYHNPQAALRSYQQAQAGYRAVGDALSVA